jgi:hypothetical protein
VPPVRNSPSWSFPEFIVDCAHGRLWARLYAQQVTVICCVPGRSARALIPNWFSIKTALMSLISRARMGIDFIPTRR